MSSRARAMNETGVMPQGVGAGAGLVVNWSNTVLNKEEVAALPR